VSGIHRKRFSQRPQRHPVSPDEFNRAAFSSTPPVGDAPAFYLSLSIVRGAARVDDTATYPITASMTAHRQSRGWMVWVLGTHRTKRGVYRILLEWRDGFQRQALGATERQQMTLEDAIVYWGRLRIFNPAEAGVAFIMPDADRAMRDQPKRAIFFFIPPELLAMTDMPPVEQVPLDWTMSTTTPSPTSMQLSDDDDPPPEGRS
jgi:hypothetical protein